MKSNICKNCGMDMSKFEGTIGRSAHICPHCGYDHRDGTHMRQR